MFLKQFCLCAGAIFISLKIIITEKLHRMIPETPHMGSFAAGSVDGLLIILIRQPEYTLNGPESQLIPYL
jgi:hypothetical protein